MSTPALTRAIRLLGAAAVGVALTSTTSCLWYVDCGGWEPSQSLDLGVTVDLHAVMQLYDFDMSRSYRGLAVGAAGTIVLWGDEDNNLGSEPFVEMSSVGTADLRAISAERGSWWVVGDGGTAAVSGDHGQTWIPVDLSTTANLRAIARVGSQLVVAGDEVVLVQNADGTWTQLAAPGGAWGQLRGLAYHGERLYAVGLGGVIWSTLDPRGEWVAEPSGTQADLFAIGDRTVIAVGAGGTVLVRKANGWVPIDNDETVDLVDCVESVVLGVNGELFDINGQGELSQIDTFAGARAMANDYQEYVIAVGDGGVAFTKTESSCEGRPFLVDGKPYTASLRRDDGWCETATTAPELEPPISRARAHALAAAWAQDGLYEHASVSSFARFALELLALGAPPRLLRDLHAAIDDELRHARACFQLARRFAGVALGPGPMPTAANAFSRVGDPIATALGLFDEACVNESVAACAAAEAAARSEDPEVRRVLEGIAADERRHAVAGWAALRWLLDSHGDQVREPLRAQLARLQPTTFPRLDDFDDFDDALIPFGRLSARDHAALRNRVLEQFVRPLARAMLFPDTLTHLDEEPN